MPIPPDSKSLVPFAYGFRPFFLAALAYAMLIVVTWMRLRAGGTTLLPDLPPQFWHGHEMIFGFVVAAIAGFLLTAVPSWTGTRGFAGLPLLALATLWVTGRLAFAFAPHLSYTALAVLELSFLPALALIIALPLIRARNRNMALLGVLAALWFLDATFLCAMARGMVMLASNTLLVSLDVVLLLMTVIGGRIVPSFTANALRQGGIAAEVRSVRWIEIGTVGAMVLLVAVDAIAPGEPLAVAAAGVAALLQALRLAGWQGARSLRQPIVWVLHLAYLWLPIGLAMKAIHLGVGADWAGQWLHALTIGAAATMVVAVITRVSLGHTGRKLAVAPIIAVAYGLLSLAALIRVLATAQVAYREWVITISGMLWILAFAIVLGVYTPILLKPRVDGKPG